MIKKTIGALYSWPRSAPAAVSPVSCHRPTANPRQHRWHKIKSRKSKSATYSRKHNSKRSSFTRDHKYPSLPLPNEAMQLLRKDLREFGMT
jgi:hypothetical protein